MLVVEPAGADPELDAPPLMASTCATAIASGPGNRNVLAVTSVPRRTRDASRASPASVIHASVGPGPASPSPMRR
jgi:hypothetical protein